MISTSDIDDILGAEAVDTDNDKIGKVGQVYLDSESEQPVWVTVKSGLFGTSETLVPLSGANWDRSALHLAFTKDRVKDAPRVAPDAELSPEEQDRLYEYYGLGDGSGTTGAGSNDGFTGTDGTTAGDQVRDDTVQDAQVTSGQYAQTGTQDDSFGDASARDGLVTDSAAGTGSVDGTATGAGYGAAGTTDAAAGADTTTRGAGHDTSGPNTDDAMTRSEERLRVGTQQVESGRARLRKYIVTEQQTVTVPVSHDEVTIEREPITDANRGAALGGADLSEEEHEVVLTEDRPVVQKETVPVERVRLGTEQVTENREVTEDVRHEEITTDGDDAVGRGQR